VKVILGDVCYNQSSKFHVKTVVRSNKLKENLNMSCKLR